MKIDYQLLEKNAQKQPVTTMKGVPFGSIRTNHMFVMNYEDGEWKNPRIVPYGPFSISPGAICLHYAQEIFEGAKAYRHEDGELRLFRMDKNAARFNHSAAELMMPQVPEDLHMEAVMRLIDVERAWCPNEPESALYIRPFMFGTQDSLGVKVSNSYIFCIMLSPCGPYYPGGFSKAIRLLITEKFHRAVSGGTGTAKCGGNYAASLKPAAHAHAMGAEQVLYIDASNQYIEEVGTMNHYHVLKDGTFIIPQFNDSILKSITSQSVLELAGMGKVKARSERIRLDEFIAGVKNGEIIEAGGFGTAAVISPVGSYIFDDGETITVGSGEVGEHSRNLYKMYTDIQTGKIPAPAGWMQTVPRY